LMHSGWRQRNCFFFPKCFFGFDGGVDHFLFLFFFFPLPSFSFLLFLSSFFFPPSSSISLFPFSLWSGTTEWSKVLTHRMQWVVQEVKQTDAEKGPPEFLDYPHIRHPRCIVCYRPATINCLDCHGDVYCETMSQFNTDGDPVSCWSTFHGKEGT
jgi:hypothetical protein